MLHSTTSGAIRRKLNIANYIQATSITDLQYNDVLQTVDPKADIGDDGAGA